MFFLVAFVCIFALSEASSQVIPLEIPKDGTSYENIPLIRKPFRDEFPSRIVNGKEAKPHAYPFLARLLVIWGQEGGLCGATILNNNYILTAAHCFYHPETGAFAKSVQVTMGDHIKSKVEATEVMVYGSQIYLYGYNKRTHYNDIAIIEAANTISFTPQIQPGCIVSSGKDYTGTMATAAGWGTIGSGKPTSDVLLEVNIPVLPDSTCKNTYRNLFYPDVMLCGGYTDGTKDTCQGDSGGPLFFEKNGKFTVVGLTSFGVGCAEYGFPGIYTRVSKFTSTITDTAGNVCIN